jgi:ABC-type transporter Mla MlaB component
MLRITTTNTPERFVLKLEGKLSHAWVHEADESWRAALATSNGSPIDVDLCDVYAIDDGGRALLGRMHRAGARFVTRGCVMGEMVREILEHEQAKADEAVSTQEGTRA